MAIQSQPSRIPEPFAGSGTKNTIPATNATPSASQAASWASGFPPECSQPISAGGCPVPRDDVNGALNQITQDYAFRQDGGIWEWSALADYDASRVVRGSDGKLYFSLQASGPGTGAGAQDPTTDSTQTYWINETDIVHKFGQETIKGNKAFANTHQYATGLQNELSCIFVQDDTLVMEQNPSVTKFLGMVCVDKDSQLFGYDGRVCALEGARTAGGNAYVGIKAYNPHAARGSNDSRGIYVGYLESGGSVPSFHANVQTFKLRALEVETANIVGTVTSSISFCENNGTTSLADLEFNTYTSGANRVTRITLQNTSNPWSEEGNVGVAVFDYGTNSGKLFAPTGPASGTINLGGPYYKWNTVYAATGSINTSDSRLKTEPEAIPDEVLDAWGDVGFVQFQMLESVAKKGEEGARLHSGLIAQRIDEAFKAHGLDAGRYGLFCYDKWDDIPEEGIKAGDQYSLRYEEALCMEAAYQRRRADRAEARLAALEERLAAIEAKLG